MTTASPAIVETDGSREQVWPLPTDEQSLLDLVHLCFDQYWDDIWFGVLIQGAAWEVAAPNPPKRISVYDGYATIDFGRWHFHLCIGEHKASGPELGRIRRCARAELYRGISGRRLPHFVGRPPIQRPQRANDYSDAAQPVLDQRPADPRPAGMGAACAVGSVAANLPRTRSRST
jgi:hypothetical protein